MGMALLEEGIASSSHFGSIIGCSIDIERGKLGKLSGVGDTETKHVLFLAGDSQVVLPSIVINEVDLFEIVLTERIDLEYWR
jgi:hypothetical protein